MSFKSGNSAVASINKHPSLLFFFWGGGIKTIPWAYVRQEILLGHLVFPPARPTCCSKRTTFNLLLGCSPSLGTFLRGWSECWKFGHLDVLRSVSMNTRSNVGEGGFVFFLGVLGWTQQKKPGNWKKKKRPMFFFVCVCGRLVPF